MKTEDLIRVLADNGSRPVTPIAQTLSKALALGTALSAVFLLVDPPRSDLAEALLTVRFDLKLAVSLLLAGASAMLLVETARPVPARHPRWTLLLPLLLLAGSIVFELVTTPSNTWATRLTGHNAFHCVSQIPLLSLPLLTCLLIALRGGASLRPALTGMTAGLSSAAIAASLYALTCRDDSPLFVAVWYSMAAAIVGGVSACIGARLLRW